MAITNHARVAKALDLLKAGPVAPPGCDSEPPVVAEQP